MITVSGCVSPTIAGAMNLNEVSEHLFPVTAVQGRLLHRRICNLYKRKQENLPTQVGLDVLQSDLDTRSLRLFLQLFQATILRVRTDDDLSRPVLAFRKPNCGPHPAITERTNYILKTSLQRRSSFFLPNLAVAHTSIGKLSPRGAGGLARTESRAKKETLQ